MVTPQTELRKNVRFQVDLPVRISASHLPGSVELATADISVSGAFLVSESPLPVNSLLSLELLLPGPNHQAQFSAEVVHSDPTSSPPGMGVRFRRTRTEDHDALVDFLRLQSEARRRDGRKAPVYVHPIPCEAHFQGRYQEVHDLLGWLRDNHTGVVSIVGLGGAGKSVLLGRALRLAAHTAPAGLFAWSFYQNQDVDSFLREALAYTGAPVNHKLTGLGRVYALTAQLKRSGRIFLALDGLERVQGTEDHDHGHVEDPALRLLLEKLAIGCGQAVAVITSRFPLVDLEDLRGQGWETIALDRLDPEAAVGLLRARGVSGEDEELRQLADRYGGHALTVSLLGSFLQAFGGQAAARERVTNPTVQTGTQSQRLGTVLDAFCRHLPKDETAVLERLAAFRNGTTASTLNQVFLQTQPATPALGRMWQRMLDPLKRMDETRLGACLERLTVLHLISVEGDVSEPRYAFHAAVKDHFYDRLLTSGQGDQTHERVREHLAERPLKRRPDSDLQLAMVEELVHHTLRAGRTEEAFQIYWERLNGYDHLGRTLGEYVRGVRLTCAFFQRPHSCENALPGLDPWHAAMLAGDAGLFLEKLGEFERAVGCHALGIRQALAERDWANVSAGERNIAKIRLAQGRLSEALRVATNALDHAQRANVGVDYSHALVGAVEAHLGKPLAAENSFRNSLGQESVATLHGRPGVWHAELMIRTGDDPGALRIARHNLRHCQRHDQRQTEMLTRLQLAELALRGEAYDLADEHLEAAELFALSSGWEEGLVVVHTQHSRRHMAKGEDAAGMSAATEGLRLATRLGLGLHAINLEIIVAQLADPPDLRALEQLFSDAEALGYRWGMSEALHQKGQLFLKAGGKAQAKSTLKQALGIRQLSLDARLSETEELLAATS